MLTVEQLQEALPTHLKHSASQELVNKVNRFSSEPEFAEMVRNNLVSYTSVLKEGRFRTDEYINAVTYVSMKLMGFTNQDAWCNTFPDRHQNLAARGAGKKEISAYVAAYNKSKLVNLVLEQAMVPTWVLNQDMFQKAINKQAELMLTATSEKVQQEAANSLLTHLKPPEKAKLEIDVTHKDNSGMAEMKDIMMRLAEKQQELIQQGTSTKEIAHQDLIDITPEKED